MQKNKKLEYKCPICNTNAKLDSSNKFRPFCCKRCKLIDLGAWANGSYAIETNEHSNDENDNE